MTPRRSKSRLRIALGAVLVLVLNGLLFAAVTWPRLTRVRRAESRAQQVSIRRDSLEKLWSRIQAKKDLVARNRADIDALRRDHVKSRERDLFPAQREIEALARESGLHPKRSSYSLNPIPGTGLVRCEVTLPLDGSYSNLMDFLSRIESAKRFVVVDQLALSEDAQGARMNLKLWAIFTDGGSGVS